MRSVAVYIFFSLAAMVQAAPAHGQTFTLVPSSPRSTDIVQVRIDIQGCDATTGTASVDEGSHRIVVQVTTPDTCDASNPAHTTTPRFIHIGQLSPGQYTVDYQSCPFNPGPPLPCNIFLSQQLTVSGVSSTHSTIPALSQLGGLGLLGAVLAIGVWPGVGLRFARSKFIGRHGRSMSRFSGKVAPEFEIAGTLQRGLLFRKQRMYAVASSRCDGGKMKTITILIALAFAGIAVMEMPLPWDTSFGLCQNAAGRDSVSRGLLHRENRSLDAEPRCRCPGRVGAA